METKWWYFFTGAAFALAVGAFVLFPRTDSTLYSCGTGDPLPAEMQIGSHLELTHDGFFSFYSGEWSDDEILRRCAKEEAVAMTRAVACTVIAQIDGRDNADVLEEAWAADILREERYGHLPDAVMYSVYLSPSPSYFLRGNWNQGDGWEDWLASDVLVYYDHDDNEVTLGDICFGEYLPGFPLSSP